MSRESFTDDVRRVAEASPGHLETPKRESIENNWETRLKSGTKTNGGTRRRP